MTVNQMAENFLSVNLVIAHERVTMPPSPITRFIVYVFAYRIITLIVCLELLWLISYFHRDSSGGKPEFI